jgi:hypothetical protein
VLGIAAEFGLVTPDLTSCGLHAWRDLCFEKLPLDERVEMVIVEAIDWKGSKEHYDW